MARATAACQEALEDVDTRPLTDSSRHAARAFVHLVKWWNLASDDTPIQCMKVLIARMDKPHRQVLRAATREAVGDYGARKLWAILEPAPAAGTGATPDGRAA